MCTTFQTLNRNELMLINGGSVWSKAAGIITATVGAGLAASAYAVNAGYAVPAVVAAVATSPGVAAVGVGLAIIGIVIAVTDDE